MTGLEGRAREVAAGLSYAQAAAVREVFAWQSPQDQETGEAELYRLGIWNPRPKHGEKAITAFGLAVRRILEETK